MKSLSIQPLKHPVIGEVMIPGSKSVTNRALIMASLTRREVTLEHFLQSDDTEAMIDCLTQLGIRISRMDSHLIIHNSVWDLEPGEWQLNTRLSGTTMRFMIALATLITGTTHIRGEGRLNERPIGDLVDALRQLDSAITYKSTSGFPPVIIQGGVADRKNKTIHIKGTTSSQFVSAILMIAPYIGGLEICIEGRLISASYVDLTIEMMRSWGEIVKNQSYERFMVPQGQYDMARYPIEGDYSASGYFAGIAVLTQSTITLKNLPRNSSQGDKRFLDILESMGSDIAYFDDSVRIVGNGVIPVDVDMTLCPDQAQTLAVLSAFAPGTTRMTGVRSLRVKETERVQAIQNELSKMGIQTESPDEDTLIVHGGSPHGASIETYHDHRMAMSFAMAGLRIPGIEIRDPDVVGKTFPDYWEKLKELGVKIVDSS